MIERELEALVAVSSPSGDVEGAEECVALATAFMPPEAEIERIDCSTPDHAQDLVGRVRGKGTRRLLLLGHLDTVVHHGAHRPVTRDGDRLIGSNTDGEGFLRALAEAGVDRRGLDTTLRHEHPALSSPPYHAVECVSGITTTTGGLRVDGELRVLDADGKAVPSLYAAGADAGGVFAGVTGGCLGWALVSGFVAARTALGTGGR
jgi:hypothetical protein